MKIVIKITLVLVIIVGACVILTALIISRPQPGDEEAVAELIQPEVTVDSQDSWPMFRGGQQLLGRASGTLPDSLRFVWKFKTNGQVKSSPVIDDQMFMQLIWKADTRYGHTRPEMPLRRHLVWLKVRFL
jgi:hypothetical protein